MKLCSRLSADLIKTERVKNQYKLAIAVNVVCIRGRDCVHEKEKNEEMITKEMREKKKYISLSINEPKPKKTTESTIGLLCSHSLPRQCRLLASFHRRDKKKKTT